MALAVGFGCPTFPGEGLLLFKGEEFEVLIVKSTGVVAFDLLSIRQGDGSRFIALVSVVAAPVILVFVTLLLPGSCLFDSPHVFVFVIAVSMPSDNVLFDISHGLQMGVVWSVLLS